MENENKGRLRGQAMVITTKTKQRLSKEFGEALNEGNKEKFIKYIEDKFTLSSEGTDDTNNLDFDAPIFKGVCTEKNPKVKFSENAYLVKLGFEPEYIQTEPTVCNFKHLLNNFEENKIDQFEIQDLLNYDFEEMNNAKDKLSQVIDKLSILVSSNTQGNSDETRKKNEALAMLCNKLNEIKNSEKNAKTVINNIDKVSSLIFSGDKLTVKFD